MSSCKHSLFQWLILPNKNKRKQRTKELYHCVKIRFQVYICSVAKITKICKFACLEYNIKTRRVLKSLLSIHFHDACINKHWR